MFMRHFIKSGWVLGTFVAGTLSMASMASAYSQPDNIPGFTTVATLFTTASDFTVETAALVPTGGPNNGWTGQGAAPTSSLVATAAADNDGNNINGLGNINTVTGVSSAGAADGLGGMQQTDGGGWDPVESPEEAAVPYVPASKTPNLGFFNALAASSLEYIAVDFTLPANLDGTYEQPGIIWNNSVDGYNQTYGQINMNVRTPVPAGTVVSNNTPTYFANHGAVVADDSIGLWYTMYTPDPWSAGAPVSLTQPAGDLYSYFQLLFNLNGDYTGTEYFDNIRLVTVPEPATLGLLGLSIPALLIRRRKA